MKVSIITIVRNAETYIDRTIESVLAQTYPEIEYLIIDGASTDGTFAKVQRYQGRVTRMVSEPDAGIADAWNKGLRLSTGQVVGLLNAGDEYSIDAVEKAVASIKSGHDFVYGDTDLVSDNGEVLRSNRGRFSLWYYSAGYGFYHPSCFATRALYDRIGGFDVRYRYAMDSDWIARAVVAGASFGHSSAKARMVDGGVSVKSRFLAYGEHLQALERAGVSSGAIYGSMLMTGLRGLVRNGVRGLRG